MEMANANGAECAVSASIRAWHAHVLFPASSKAALDEATALWRRLSALRDSGTIDNEVGRIWGSAVGPHNAAQFQVWVPKESFADLIAFLAVNRGSLTVMVHPLTREELVDHTDRLVWLGPRSIVSPHVLSRLLDASIEEVQARPARVRDPSPHYWDFKAGKKAE